MLIRTTAPVTLPRKETCYRKLLPLSKSPCLSLPLHQGEDIAFSHRTFHVSNDRSVRVVQELNSHLSHVTGASGTSEHLVHLGELDLLIHRESSER